MKFLVRTFLAALTLIATLLTACSSISHRQSLRYPFPPDKEHVDIWGRDPVQVDGTLEKRLVLDPKNDAVRVLVRYQQAKLWATHDAAKSCTLWKEVFKETRFPLLQIAKIRAQESCPDNSGPTISEVMEGTKEPWLRELSLRSTLKRAKRMGDKEWELKLSRELAPLEDLQSEKVAHLSRALQLAKDLNQAEAVTALETELKEIAPRYNETPKPDQMLAVANDFKQVRNFNKAREWYKRVASSEEFNDWDKLKALDGVRMSFKLEKKVPDYLRATHELSDFARKRFLRNGLRQGNADQASSLLNRYFQTRLTLARAVWTEDSPRTADQILRDTERELRGRVATEEAILIRARIQEEAGDFKGSHRTLSQIDVSKVQSRDLRSKILWYRAWNLRKAKKYKEALRALENLVANGDESVGLAARNRFWLGKTYKDVNQADKATPHFEWLIENDSVGWYGLLSYRELGRLIPALGTPASIPRTPASETPSAEASLLPDESLTLEWLVSTGELDLARVFIDTVTADRRSSFSDAQSLDLLKLYARAGQYQSLFTRLYELPATTRKRLLDAHPELLFPQPWAGVVQTAASRFDIQTELIYSIMRQESAFNHTARSHADAFGLMQLIPESAKRAEKATGIVLKDPEEMYLPETNIPLGAAFLRELFDHWKGRYIPAVASYNASEKAIAGWLRTRYRGDALEFVEDIPYEETRNYVKLVTRNLVFYKRLNSGASPIEFPEWCLSSLHVASQ